MQAIFIPEVIPLFSMREDGVTFSGRTVTIQDFDLSETCGEIQHCPHIERQLDYWLSVSQSKQVFFSGYVPEVPETFSLCNEGVLSINFWCEVTLDKSIRVFPFSDMQAVQKFPINNPSIQ